MIFGNKSLDSFSPAKVLKWDSSLASDFEHQQLAYRGGVLAAAEAPVTKTIEAEILVRGRDYDAIKARLDGIAEWLYGSGVNKLFVRNDTSHYYMARCTQISTPAYNGLSARITVTFLCIDYRLYNVSTDTPVSGTLDTNLSNFTFAGKHCLNDYGCLFIRDSIDALAAARLNKYRIPGQLGTLRYDGRFTEYDERKVSGTLYFVKGAAHNQLMTQTEIDSQMHTIAAWLGNAGRDYLIFDSDTTRRYIAEVEKVMIIEGGDKSDWLNGCLRVEITLQSYSEDVEEVSQTKTLTVSNGFTSIQFSDLLPRGYGYVTPVKMTLVNNGPNAISDLQIRSQKTSGFYISAGSLNEDLCRIKYGSFPIILVDNDNTYERSYEIDTDTSDIVFIAKNRTSGTVTRTSHREYLYSGGFPMLFYFPEDQRTSSSGFLRFAFYSDVETSLSVTVTARARWL